jgi:hypothetical protein
MRIDDAVATSREDHRHYRGTRTGGHGCLGAAAPGGGRLSAKELGISKRQATRARKPARDRGRRAAKDTFLTKTQQFRSLCPNLNL